MKALSFEGSGTEYFKIWIVNVLLVLVTFGLYYPWAKVRNHRYFYANSTLEDRNFEYHATGKQLFFGYLIAMTLFIVYMIVAQVSPLGSILLPLALFLAIPWILWRSLKFNMRMTSFSNVRFGFKGTVQNAYINFFLYPLIFMTTLYLIPMGSTVGLPILLLTNGIHQPEWAFALGVIVAIASVLFSVYIFALIKKKNASYRIDGTRFGQGIFRTELETKKFLMIMLKTLGVSIAVLMVVITLVLLVSSIIGGTIDALRSELATLQSGMADPATMDPTLLMTIGAIFYGVIIFSAIFIAAYSFTRHRTYIYANSTLDKEITFESTLKAREFSWVMLSNFLMIIFTLGLAYPWAKVRMARLTLENTLVNTDVGIENYMTEKQREESSLGEQIGDAFDVDVDLGF